MKKQPSKAENWANAVQAFKNGAPSPTAAWQKILHSKLLEQVPIAAHESIFADVYSDWDASKQGPAPAWFPGPREMQSSQLALALKERGFAQYSQLLDWSIRQRGDYWKWAIDKTGIVFDTPYDEILDPKNPFQPNWLRGAELNIAKSCFKAPTNKRALVCTSESGSTIEWTYGELQTRALQVTAGLRKLGYSPGDRFAVFLPMHAEAVAIYLGIVLFGGAVVSIADSFSTEEIDTRLRLSNAKLIFTQDGMLRGGKFLTLYPRAKASIAECAVVIQSQPKEKLELRKRDLTWDQFLPTPAVDWDSVFIAKPSDITNVLFSSGTTGDPKAIPWTHTTPIKAAVDAYFHLDVGAADVVAWPTNLGWMMGPWLIYASLINEACIALYEGGPATKGFGEFVQKQKVTVLGLVPSIVKSWKESHCMEGMDWGAIKCFSSTGECSNAQDYLYLMALAQYRPVIEYCGGTEVGGAYITSTLLQPNAPAAFTTPTLGMDFEILDENAHSAAQGEIFLVPPSIGLSTTLLNRDHAEVYEKGVPRGARNQVLRRHGDQMEALPGGFYRALGRADDTMNLGGIKVSSAEIERVLNRVEGVLETAAIAMNPPGGGPSLLVLFTVLKKGSVTPEKDLLALMQKRIKSDLNPLFKIHALRIVEKLPRTASNKVMRRVLRQEYEKGN